jgi:hypothetical protein
VHTTCDVLVSTKPLTCRCCYNCRRYSDICHVAPNVCSKDGHLQRLVLPPYALRCSSFPKVSRSFPCCGLY